jgi:hypothetical protein
MKGSYNAVTQSASGEYTKSDYQERRKDTALSGGVLIAVLAILAVVIWYFWTQARDALTNAAKGLGAILPNLPSGSITPEGVTAANSETPEATSAINNVGQYYPVKTLTKDDYDKMLTSLGMLQPVVKLGNVITPPAITTAATQAGAEAAATVNKLGLNNAYVDLPALQKGLVTLGEGVGKAAGVDLIQAGYDFRASIASSFIDGGS